ncbi:fatty acid CoA ligase family protein [Motilimonas pumila]|uniref:Peptide synthase n=1 Tax=Motilimonas pumila TaxID=2303987 RepID=A0A418YB15_9GAMM|nr:fatty acid CoA ligase family protein [Motilimonas pumila]RJG40159.1 peptide synthase [Motilimonas pumila]
MRDPQNIANHLAHMAKAQPSALAVAIQHHLGFSRQASFTELSFSQLDQECDHACWALQGFGIKATDKVVLMVTPSVDFFALTFALFRLGAVPIFVDPGMGINNLKQCFEEAKPDHFIGISKAHIARVLFGWGKTSIKSHLAVAKHSWLTTFAGIKRTYPNQGSFVAPAHEANAMAAILFTSGSTGTPKGVVYSHEMFNAQIAALRDDYGIRPGERDLATFPLFALFGPALGMASIIPDMDASKPITANPDYIKHAIDHYQCSNLFANPALLNILGQAGNTQHWQLKSIKRVISAGAPATPESIELFQSMLMPKVEIWTSYGATESLPISKIGSHELLRDTQQHTREGGGICVGYPIADVTIDIIAITDEPIALLSQAQLLKEGQIGEIIVKGAVVSRQYYHRDNATLSSKIDDDIQGGHYHRMGDLGYLDDAGKLWMCGRKSHRVSLPSGDLFTLCCERIFNEHTKVSRTALVEVSVGQTAQAALCIEANTPLDTQQKAQVIAELQQLAAQQAHTKQIQHFFFHRAFPVDVRHNAKIFREKLSVWAQQELEKQ